MKRFIKSVIGAGASLAVAAPAFAAGNLTMPTVDYTDFYAGGALILGVAVTVMLVKRVKGLIR